MRMELTGRLQGDEVPALLWVNQEHTITNGE
jgi:hypothetical protein